MQRSSFFLTCLLISGTSAAVAYSPLDLYLGLVAGNSRGFEDGNFNDSRFNNPTGMTFDADGKTLYVADRGNNRIRIIHTDRNNEVETLAGTGETGATDGPFNTATFNGPCNIVSTGDSLLVYESGNHLLRVLDLKTKTVVDSISLIDHNLTQAAYCPLDQGYYFTDMTAHRLVRIDLKTKTRTILFEKDDRIPVPQAICYMDNGLYLTDAGPSRIYRFPIDPKAPLTAKTLQWNCVGNANGAISFVPADGIIYALRKGEHSLSQVYPAPRDIQIPTIWGFFAPNDNDQAEPLVCFDPYSYCSGAVSSQDPQKLYLCGMMSASADSIFSFRDYDYSNHWYGIEPRDYLYPATKPPHTFRILVAGDSRVVTSPLVDPKDPKGGGSLLMDTYAKQLEIMLNTEAALRGASSRFEVLIESHLDQNWMVYGNYDMEDLVTKYDIDLILPVPTWNYKDFYRRPIGADGLPAKTMDMEYFLKPLAQRVPPGPAGELYRYWAKKPFIGDSVFLSHEFTKFMTDPIVKDCVVRMLSIPLSSLAQKISKLKLKDGSTPRLIPAYFPWDAEVGDSATLETAYGDLCARSHVPILDIAPEFNLLRTTYSPVQQRCCDNHYTAYGNRLIAMLLCRHLIADKLVPLEPFHSSK